MQQARKMNSRYSFDHQRGLMAIHRDPIARDIPSPDEVRRWVKDGSVPYTQEPDRCLGCGRSEQCECLDCPTCVNGTPHIERRQPSGNVYGEMDDS